MIRLELTDDEALSLLAAISTERDRVAVFGPSPHRARLLSLSDRLVDIIEAERGAPL